MVLYFSIVTSIFALIFAGLLAWGIKKREVKSKKAQEIAGIIHQGALTFLHKEYKILLIFGVTVFSLLLVFLGPKIAWSFVLGAGLSALAGNIGMRIATLANVRTAEGVQKSLKQGLGIAFSSGSVMGMCVVGLGLLGVSVLYIIFQEPEIIYGFGFGASAIALFARVGGGIYTKAADVGADLVGKVEAGIPEDDPRNPATIADNVGDNVGDVAGMGADLFESYVDAIIAAMVIGALTFSRVAALSPKSFEAVLLPLLLAGAGIIAALIGNLFIKLSPLKLDPHKVLNRGIWGATIVMAGLAYLVINSILGVLGLFISFLAGLIAGIGIGLVTEYYTAKGRTPVKKIVNASQTGAATNIIAGFSLGMESTLLPIIIISIAIFVAYLFGGLYGIAIAAVGMLSTLGITLATDTYGPVADNAAGIAEMTGMGRRTRERAEELDAVGNTTAAIGKGFAIGAAALTALVLLVSFGEIKGLTAINLLNARVIIGLFLGGMMPFLFSSFALSAVGRAAIQMVNEVRRQFKEIKGIMQGKVKPDYNKCIDISTAAALREMIIPGVLVVIVPLLIGFVLGAEALAGLLGGAIVTGFLLAVTMANSGGAWDNAKKYIEAGNLGGKGSFAHKSAVVGDTVGDPFKDTAGPSLNILIKLMSIVALIIAPLL